MKRLSSVLCSIVLCFWFSKAYSQRSPHEMMMKIFEEGLERAQKHLEANEEAEAKLILLGLVGQRMSYDRNKSMDQICAAYDKLVGKAWGSTLQTQEATLREAKAKISDTASKFGFRFGKKKSAPPPTQEAPLASQEEIQKATELCIEFKPKLKDYDIVFYNVLRTLYNPNLSRSEQAERVSKFFEVNPEAKKVWLEFAQKAPQPKAIYAADTEMVQMLTNYVVGNMWGVYFGTQILVPEYLECAKKAIGEAKEGKDSATVKSKAQEASQCVATVLAIDPQNAEAKSYQSEVEQLTEKAKEMRRKEIAQNKLPADRYRGKDKKQVIQGIKSAFEKRWSKEKVLKVVIISEDWTEKAEAWIDKRQGSVEANVFRFIDAAVAVEKEDGTCMVYYARFARAWTGTGNQFGEIVYSQSLGKEYEILKENIK